MNKTKELVAAGYALAKELHCAESAALVRELATQLDLQRVRADTLAADNENALAVLKEANQTVLRAKASFEDTEAKNAALVAELSAVETIYDAAVLITSEHYEQCPPEVQKMIRSLAVLQIPAYTAFLAEVRAQVWIEGSEPEEFGRYWVRYETDVGPQYCSAKWMEHNFCAGSNTNIHKIWVADHSRSINSLRGVTHYTKLPDSLEGAAQ